MTKPLSNTTKKRATKAVVAPPAQELEWTYADFHFRSDEKLRLVEAVRVDGETWYLVSDAVRLITDLVRDTYDYNVEEDIETSRLITHERTGETRRFIDEAQFAHLLLTWSRGFVC